MPLAISRNNFPSCDFYLENRVLLNSSYEAIASWALPLPQSRVQRAREEPEREPLPLPQSRVQRAREEPEREPLPLPQSRVQRAREEPEREPLSQWERGWGEGSRVPVFIL